MEERIFTINLRKITLKSPRWEKSKRSVIAVKNFLKRHMKGDEVKIGKSITEEIWKRGNQNPPKNIRIHAILTEDEESKIVQAELIGVPFPEEKEKKKEKKKEEKPKEEVKKEGKPEQKPEEEEKEKIKEEPKKEEKK